MKKLLSKFKDLLYFASDIQKDKLAHFFGSSLLLVISSVILPLGYAYLVVFLSAFFKEFVWDGYLKRGQKDKWDLAFSLLPILFDIIIKL